MPKEEARTSSARLRDIASHGTACSRRSDRLWLRPRAFHPSQSQNPIHNYGKLTGATHKQLKVISDGKVQVSHSTSLS